MLKRIGLWAFVVAAVALTAWGVASYVSPGVDCRGVPMGPGDLCHYSSATQENTDQVQSYEQRVATVRQQVPFVIGLGVAATVFGVVLALRSGQQRHGAVDGAVLLHEGDVRHPVGDQFREEER